MAGLLPPVFIFSRALRSSELRNGGYVCGQLARHIPGGAEVTLRASAPPDRQLDVVATDDGLWIFAMAPHRTIGKCGTYAPGEGKLRRSMCSRATDADQATRASAADVFRVRPCKGAGRRPAHFSWAAWASIPERFGSARGDLDPGSDLGGGGRLRRVRISPVGARLSHGLCFLAGPGERQLRPDADPVGSDVGTDRDTAAPGRTLRHHCVGGRPRRP